MNKKIKLVLLSLSVTACQSDPNQVLSLTSELVSGKTRPLPAPITSPTASPSITTKVKPGPVLPSSSPAPSVATKVKPTRPSPSPSPSVSCGLDGVLVSARTNVKTTSVGDGSPTNYPQYCAKIGKPDKQKYPQTSNLQGTISGLVQVEFAPVQGAFCEA